MSFRNLKSVLLACSGAAVLLAATTAANAGGFALREQSAAGQGASFAGVAAGGALSSMFWNPSTMTQFSGKTFEGDVAAIIPSVNHSYTASTLAPFYPATPGNSGLSAAVPSFYASWQFADQWWVGLSVNTPFGLAVTFPRAAATAGYAQSTDIKSYNFSPSIAFKVNEMLSVSVGAQIQYMKISYDGFAGLALPTPALATINGNGYSYGYTLGATLTPMAGTKIGIGYRSQLDQKLSGSFSTTTGVNLAANTTVPLPALFSLGLNQRLSDRWTLLAEFEWQNWGRIGQPLLFNSATGGTITTFPLAYSDGYFYSLGAEYQFDPNLKLRAGIAFEKSPITDQVRTPRLPDNDRMWYSIGASYKPSMWPRTTFDIGYSFIKSKNTPINVVAGNPSFGGAGVYIGSVDANVNIISVAMRYQWDDAQAKPIHQRYTK